MYARWCRNCENVGTHHPTPWKIREKEPMEQDETWIIFLTDAADIPRLVFDIQDSGLEIAKFNVFGAIVANGPRQAANKVRSIPGVESVSKDDVRTVSKGEGQ